MPFRYKTFTLSLITGASLFGDSVFAAEPGGFARALGVAYPDTWLVLIRILQIIWLLATIGALGFLVYGYVLLRRADPEDLYEAPRAKRMMLYSGIAAGVSLLLFIILTITYVVIEGGYKPKLEPGDTERFGGLGGQILFSESKIKDHYPLRDERNVPRDTALLITFADPISKDSVLDSTNAIRRDSILVRKSAPSQTRDYGVVVATGVLSVDGKTLKIIPSALLGSPDQKMLYTVALTSSVLDAKGKALFSEKEGGYSWQFEVSGLIDTTPPTVAFYLPIANSVNPLNTLIQTTFSEPVDPFTVTADSFAVLTGDIGAKEPIVGTWSIGNGYRTITFVSAASCGTNQCGSAVFCLPAQKSIDIRIKAAALATAQGGRVNPNRAQFPYTGIVDTAGNSLDGGGINGQARNGKSEGAEKDDFLWSVSSGTEKETTPPTLLSIAPGRDAQGVSLTAPVTALFSPFMDITSLNASTVGFSKEVNVWISGSHLFSERRTRAEIHHEPFKANETYTPVVRSGVTDIYQNCYNPCTGPSVQQTLQP